MAGKDKELSEDELKRLKKDAKELLSRYRCNILYNYPFIGSVAMKMDLIPVRDLRVPTACTDGDNIYFDIAFLSELSFDEGIFVLAHEVWHAVLMHLVRRKNRIPELFNIATDKEVNSLLSKDGFKAPPMVLFPDKNEEGKCAEEIYEMLLKKYKNAAKKNGNRSSKNGAGGSMTSMPGEMSNSSNDGSSEEDDEADDNGKQQSKSKKLSGQFDRHVYENEAEDDEKSITVTDKYGKVGLDPDFKPRVSKNFSDRMKETIVSAAQQAEKIKGDLPAHIKDLVKHILEPEVKWEEVLAQFVTRCYHGAKRSWIPPNRRHIHNDIYLQSRHSDKLRVVVGIDTSGSTYNDRSKFLGELVGLIRSFSAFELHYIECDAEVGFYKMYTQDDDLDSIIENEGHEMTGGGGTAMLPIFEHVLDHQIEADAIIIMTDGYIETIEKNPIPSMPTLWLVTKDGTMDFCNWGQKLKLAITKNDCHSLIGF